MSHFSRLACGLALLALATPAGAQQPVAAPATGSPAAVSTTATVAEQMLYGLPVDDSGPGAEYRGALEDFFAAYQPELVAAEVVASAASAMCSCW